ncbi:MAG: permease [Candidatus Undinarchaeales archaeon]|nr:permease [Candidatus Undinarchaeales archaeon]MDP7491622.1 permease [Candidatus Undinarchaeales archaeon]
MLVPTLLMGALALVLLYIGHSRGEGQHLTGLRAGLDMTVQVMPLLIAAFVVAGMVQVPDELVTEWVGAESGPKGILVGSAAGALAPGGPYVSFPLAAGFLKAGASVGTMVAFVTVWSLWSVHRLPMEVGILGWKFTLVHMASTILFPPIAGLIAHTFFSGAT